MEKKINKYVLDTRNKSYVHDYENVKVCLPLLKEFNTRVE